MTLPSQLVSGRKAPHECLCVYMCLRPVLKQAFISSYITAFVLGAVDLAVIRTEGIALPFWN